MSVEQSDNEMELDHEMNNDEEQKVEDAPKRKDLKVIQHMVELGYNHDEVKSEYDKRQTLLKIKILVNPFSGWVHI